MLNRFRDVFSSFKRHEVKYVVVGAVVMKPKSTKLPKLKPVPKFRSETEEREFWATADSIEFIDWTSAKLRKLPNLRPSPATISIRPA